MAEVSPTQPLHHITPLQPAASPSKISVIRIQPPPKKGPDTPDLSKRVPPETQKLYKTVHESKKLEREEVFTALQKVDRSKLAEFKSTPHDLKKYVDDQLFRALQRQEQRDPTRKAEDLIKPLRQLDNLTVETVRAGLVEQRVDSDAVEAIIRDIESGFTLFHSNTFEKEYKELCKQLEKIDKLLQRTDEDKGKVNQEILFTMRKAFDNPAYMLMKEQEEHPAIAFLHNLCMASYSEPRVFHAFQKIGAHIDEVTPKELPLHEKLRQSRDEGYKHGLIKKAASFEYIRKHFSQIIGAFWSIHIGKKIGTLIGKAYDPRGVLGNNAGALYDEKIDVKGKQVELRCVYTPSPTVGNRVSPEARAILQSMENRQLMKDPPKDSYLIWAYTNLQDIASENEGGRVQAIMRLNDEYPFSFRGTSITQDSSFFRAGVESDNESKIKKAITNDSAPLDESYAKKQLDELLHKANFTYEGRKDHPGGRYYFHAKNDEEKRAWEQDLRHIVQQAHLTVANSDIVIPEETKNWSQKAAFRELVHMGIIKRQQEKAAQEVANMNKGGKVLAANPCKENIDRGGKTQSCFLWALGAKEEDVFSAFHARALLSKYRLVLPDRVEPMYALTMCVSQQAAHAFLNNIGAGIEGGLIT